MKDSVMFANDLVQSFRFKKNIFSTYNNKTYSYDDLFELVFAAINICELNYIRDGSVVALIGDFNPKSISMLLALLCKKCIVVPLDKNDDLSDKIFISQSEFIIDSSDIDKYDIRKTQNNPDQNLYVILKERASSGLVIFTSGTSGSPKGALHDFEKIASSYKITENILQQDLILNFLLFDHWGGLNTLFRSLCSFSKVVYLGNRTPAAVCEVIQRESVTILPTTPTFLNLLIVSGEYKRWNLSSLRLITYGAEPIGQSTLQKIHEIFPAVKLKQTYGLIELGVVPTKSFSNNSLLVKLGGDNFQYRIIDDILQIKSPTTILGYLNAVTPITDDGWFITGDKVKVYGEYLHILGRESELINIGGEKFYPIEVEDVIIKYSTDIKDVLVYPEKNSLFGSILAAKITVSNSIGKEQYPELKKEISFHCKSNLSKHKIPIKFYFSKDELHGLRFKKNRSNR